VTTGRVGNRRRRDTAGSTVIMGGDLDEALRLTGMDGELTRERLIPLPIAIAAIWMSSAPVQLTIWAPSSRSWTASNTSLRYPSSSPSVTGLHRRPKARLVRRQRARLAVVREMRRYGASCSGEARDRRAEMERDASALENLPDIAGDVRVERRAGFHCPGR